MSQTGKSPQATRWMRNWLVLMGLLVYAMILIGGATRLTDSGLSITEWDPIKGALPPMSDEAWASLFAKYQQTAEYKLQNAGMSMGEFQQIFWWEWGHRLFGRLIGLVAMFGLAIFAIRGWLSRGLATRFVILILLGGLQGAIGWWMVSSGIGETTRVDVAPYRLATHFMLALLIIAYTAWLWLDLGGKARPQITQPIRTVAIVLLGLIFLQMAAGALVAGLDAGRTYNDWPLMAGEFVPHDYLGEGLGLRSLFEGRATTQFNHRMLAYIIWILALGAAWAFKGTPLKGAFIGLAALVSLQAVWGILTLMNAAPMNLALFHQAIGVIVTLAAVRLVWLTGQKA
ncbi:MAG: COX15/CtaA family protein [Alphaproteobacteria bacterium]|nr:COX15/CtaA family protein [Alphaproteobacteria bacterium]MBU2083399.1 COX15/CtaA family protein [Alphaproteobacteria bacterium]MBU2143636.1 COX15/CtaA family protein [Alphaproteobacteria bacterium]MBU2195963.1 COX15/CtaA family protein [Alphaproteobacteria bacterium]